jgi:hypothetical protein
MKKFNSWLQVGVTILAAAAFVYVLWFREEPAMDEKSFNNLSKTSSLIILVVVYFNTLISSRLVEVETKLDRLERRR